MESPRAEAAAIGRAGRLAAGLARGLLGTRGSPGRLGQRGRPATARAAWGRLVPARRGPGPGLAQQPPQWTGLRLAWPDWMVLGRIRSLGPLARTQNLGTRHLGGRQQDGAPIRTGARGHPESRGILLAQDTGRGPAPQSAPRGAASPSARDAPPSRAARIDHAARPWGEQGSPQGPPAIRLPALPPTTRTPLPPARLDPGAQPAPAQPRSAERHAGLPRPVGLRPTGAPGTPERAAASGWDLGWNLWGRLALPGRILGHGFEWLHAASRLARVHDDARADRIARAYGAEAVTLGQAIFFRTGRLDPGSPRGLSLLAHELTHVWQQARPGGVRDAAEARRHEAALEAEATGTERAIARAAAPVDATPPGSATLASAAPALPALVLGLPAPAPARVEAPPRAAPAPAPILRAAEGRPGEGEGGAGGGPDVAEITVEVYRRLLRRMRIDQERLGVGKG